MCTAISFKTDNLYFGRTLDYDFSYCEEVCITPRNYRFLFKHVQPISTHYAIIGMAYTVNNYPLYYDAVNEMGLCIAGLNFVGNAKYNEKNAIKDNLAVFELIPWLLSQCKSVDEVIRLLKKINITDTAFSDELPPASLHWLIADKYRTITLEAVKDGLKIYDNPVGVLTNNPPFDIQLFSLNDYRHLSCRATKNTFGGGLDLCEYSRGMGGYGLPGDLSSRSRFVRAAFTKANSVCGLGESESVGQFFHIMDTVAQTRGCCDMGDGNYEVSIYTSCCNASKGIYYYTTYDNRQITAVSMHKEDLNGEALIRYPLVKQEQIYHQN